MREYKEELSLAEDIGRNAFNITQKLKDEGVTYTRKADNTLVSIADLASQIYIISSIRNKFQNDQIIAEESNIKLLDDNAISLIKEVYASLGIEYVSNYQETLLYRGNISKRKWIIDPIDGTIGYKKGLYYAIGIGFMVGSTPKIAVIAVPSDNKRTISIFKAIEHGGAWTSNDGTSFKKIHINDQKELNESNLCHSLHHDLQLTRKFIKKAKIKFTTAMDSMIKFCKVSNGSCDIYFRPIDKKFKVWDFIPGELLVREAGGKVTDFKGNRIRVKDTKLLFSSSGFIATNKYLHRKALNILKRNFDIEKDI